MLAVMRRRALAFVVAAAGTAAAEPTVTTGPTGPTVPTGLTDPGEASKVFQQGRDAAKLGRFDEACALFARSFELDPALGTAVNLADCLERQGHLQRAWQLFERVARDSQHVQSRARLARQRADALRARLATVLIRVRDPGA